VEATETEQAHSAGGPGKPPSTGSVADASRGPRRISVVLPVYNEHLNIEKCLRGLWSALAAHEHEILVCYDTDDDTTLAAIAALADPPPSLRLVKNPFGRGAANALRTGFHAATGDVVVTTMADLSDPPELIPRLAEEVRKGAAVVSGSRYAKGGSQTGGPLFKRMCSQTASLSLKWVTGLSTHDATSNFRAYSRDYLALVEIESKQGFEIALELTVKAHLRGLKVSEVPSSWTDRSHGESRFRLWKWMPNYLRWYWEAMAAPVFVWTVFFSMVSAAHVFIARYASVVPFWDDLEWAPFIGKHSQLGWDWWWSAHNEHRIPLPRVFFLALIRTTDDFRSGMYFEDYALAAVALGMILVARRLRGRTSYTDAFFPLIWLTWGNAENLLMMHQISLIIPTAITCVILMRIATLRGALRVRDSLLIGLCLFSLPLCGAPGVTPAPALILWIAYAGWSSVRSGERGARRAGILLWSFAAATAALLVFYFVDLGNPQEKAYTHSVANIAAQALMFLSLSFGPAAAEYWPLSGWVTGAFALAGALTALHVFRSRPAERVRTAGLLAVGAAIVSMALATGVARGGLDPHAGFAGRYVTLPSPLLCCVYFVFCLYGPAAIGRFVRVGLYSLFAMLLFFNVQFGRTYGEKRVMDSDNFLRDLEMGMSLKELAAAHWREFFNNPQEFEFRLEFLHAIGMQPISQARLSTDETPYAMMKTKPFLATSDHPVYPRKIDGQLVLLVHPECELHFSLDSGATSLRARYGLFPIAWERFQIPAILFRVEVTPVLQETTVLFSRTLVPTNDPGDRGFHDLEVELPPNVSGELVLRVMVRQEGKAPPARDLKQAWAFWTDVEIR
jgi:glycosyltransferase involved in cell wall biosynthesis